MSQCDHRDGGLDPWCALCGKFVKSKKEIEAERVIRDWWWQAMWMTLIMIALHVETVEMQERLDRAWEDYTSDDI